MRYLYAVILIFQFVTSSFASTISWSSGDKTVTSADCSGGDCANDTLLSTGSFTGRLNLENTTNGITCVLTGHTFTYTGGVGLNIKGDDTKIVGGTFRFSGSSGDGNIGIKVQGHDVLLENVSASVGGDNAKCVYGNGQYNLYNVEIDGGTFSSSCTGYTNRCNYDAPVMKFEDLYDETDPAFSYHVYIHDVTITDGPWAGITVLGRTNDGADVNQALAYIDNNTITTDAQNDFYDHYVGQCLSSANPYGILLRHVAPGTRIYGNTITSGTDHGGNRGIDLERGKGTVDNPVLIRKNIINVHEGPNVEFGDDLPVHGLRVRYYNEYVLIDSNIVTVTMDSDVGTEHTGSYGQALRISVDASGVYLTFGNNTITATALDADIETASGFVLDYSKYTNRVSLYNNRITSSKAIYQFTEKNDQPNNANLLIYGDTVSFGGINAGYRTFSLGYLCNSWVSYGNRARDVVYLGGTSPTDIAFSCGTTGKYDIAIERTLNLYVKGSNGLPVVGATVAAKNAYGATVFSKPTDFCGLATGVVTYHYDANGWTSDSTAFNNFTLTATKGSDVNSTAFTVGYTAAGGNDTLTLNHTTGTGEWCEGPAPANYAPAIPDGSVAVSKATVDRLNDDSVKVTMPFSDQDDPGIAAFTVTFKLRYPNNFTEVTILNSQTTGNGGLTIVEDSTGYYTASYWYNPVNDQTLGYYDLYGYVLDGTDYTWDNYSDNLNELYIGESLSLSQSLTVIDTTKTSIVIQDNFSNQGVLDSVWLLLGTVNPPTTRVDSAGSPTDPDTLTASGLSSGTLYYYRTIARDNVKTDTTAVASIRTLYTVTHSITTIDSGGAYEPGQAYFKTVNNYTANTVDSLRLIYGTSSSIAAGQDSLITFGITDPDTLGCDTLTAGIYYYWWIIYDQLGADTSSRKSVVIPQGGLRFGHWSMDSTLDNYYTIEDRKRLPFFTYTGASNSTLDTIYVRIQNTTSTKMAQAALFAADSSLIDTSIQVAINLTGDRWWAFPMANADTLVNGTVYGLSVWGAAGTGDMTQRVNRYSGFQYTAATATYVPANWNPWTSTGISGVGYCPLIFGVYSASAPTVDVILIIRGDTVWKGNVVIQ